MRALATRPTKVRWWLEDEDGTPTSADASTTVDVTVLDGAGEQIATGTATEDSQNPGLYVYSLAPQALYDDLTVKFSATLGGETVTHDEVVRLQDRRLGSLRVLRQDENLSLLPVWDFLALVDQAEDLFQEALTFSPVLTGYRYTQHQPGTTRLYFDTVHYPVDVYSLTVDYGASNIHDFDATELADIRIREGALERETFLSYDFLTGTGYIHWLEGVYTVHMSRGLTETPRDLQRAFEKYVVHLGKSSVYPDRAKRIMTEQSDIWLATPDALHPTGLPEVDAVIERYTELLPV